MIYELSLKPKPNDSGAPAPTTFLNQNSLVDGRCPERTCQSTVLTHSPSRTLPKGCVIGNAGKDKSKDFLEILLDMWLPTILFRTPNPAFRVDWLLQSQYGMSGQKPPVRSQ